MENSWYKILVEKNGTLTIENKKSGEKNRNVLLYFRKGDSLFIQADSGKFCVRGNCEALVTTIGEKASPVRVAVYMTSSEIMTGLVDMDNRCLAKRKMPVYKNKDHNTVIRKIATKILEMLEEQELRIDNYIGVAAGILGLIGAANLI